MKNGWTGGQYSLIRVVLATYLLMHFLQLLRGGEASSLWLARWDSPGPVIALRATGVVLCVFLALGLYDRTAAVGIGCVGTYLLGRDPLLGNPSLPFVGLLLLAHVFMPPAPYGSWAARGRVDPAGGWRMPPAIFAAAWIVLAVGYTYSGYTKLYSLSWGDGKAPTHSGTLTEMLLALFELSFAPLALVRSLRPWLWGAILLIQLSLLAFLGTGDLHLGLVMMMLFTFDPGWIRPLGGETERLFYDGHCGLCQRSVRLIVAEDATGSAFRFAPLQGETFASLLSDKERSQLPMSLVVRTEKGTLLTRSAGVLHIMRRLGGMWRILAVLLAVLPTRLRDGLYDGVARIRLHIFARPVEACPLMPPQLRARFDP